MAKGKNGYQSSVEGTGDASHAIDDTIASCAVSESSLNPWWSVDLERRYHIHSVTIHGLAGYVLVLDDSTYLHCLELSLSRSYEFTSCIFSFSP